MTLWMKVTNDEYEFPIQIAESQKELAILCGVRRNTIARAISEARNKGSKTSWVKVEIEEDDDENTLSDMNRLVETGTTLKKDTLGT